MRCEEARRLFFLYHDSELDPRGAEEVNLHLEACPGCRDLWARERRLEEAVACAAWKSAGPLEGFPWQELEARVRAVHGPRRTWWLWGANAAALLLLACLLLSLALNRAGPSAAARSAVEHHEKYLAGKSPIQVRGPEAALVRGFYAGELGFDVIVPDGSSVAETEACPAELVGARRCTFLGGPVGYVTYRIGGRDVTVILGPLKPPESVMEAIAAAPEGLIEEDVRDCRVLMATVRGVLFVAAGGTEPSVLRRLLETFQGLR
ncbi:MAG: zf-HC2 domain-containing protein [Planctomycetes bacterium]|nr:zf-HC2 domain-containing protein [Planctomycetota bacterium]